MAVIGEIAVNIVARTGQFTKGLNAARKNLSAFSRSVATIGAPIAAGIAVAAKSFANFGDDLAKAARRTGIAVESLSALEFAAAQSGSSLAAIETGLQGMSRALLNAQRGSAETVFAFNQLGVSVEAIQGQMPEQQFLLLAQALAKIKDPTEKAGLAMKVFGRSGTQLIPLFNEGKNGIAALIQEAKDLGIVMSQEDSIAAEKLNDAFGRLTFQFKAVTKEIAVAVSGPLLDFLDRAKEVGVGIINWIRENQSLVVSVAKVGLGLTALSATSAIVAKGIGVLSSAIKGLTAASLFLLKNPLVALVAIIGTGAVIAVDKLTGASKKLTEWLGGVGSSADAAASGVGKLRGEVEQLSEGMKRLADLAFQNPMFPRGERTADSHMFRLLQRQQERLDEMQAAFGANPTMEQARQLEEQRGRVAHLERRVNRRLDEANAGRDAARQLSGFLQDSLFAPFRRIHRGLTGGADALTGGRLPQQGLLAEVGKFTDKLGGTFDMLARSFGENAPRDMVAKLAEIAEKGGFLGDLPEVFRESLNMLPQQVAAAGTITLRGSQRAFELEAGRQNKPLNKVEKNTLDTVKAVNGVKEAVNNVASLLGAEPVFSIPAS